MDIQVISNNVDNINRILNEEFKNVDEYFEKSKANPLRTAGSKPLLDGNFYIEVYSEATNRNSECAELRIILSRLKVDIDNALHVITTQTGMNMNIMRSLKNQLDGSLKSLSTYLQMLEYEQRKIDNILRFYSAVQYTFASPHYTK